MIDVAPSGAADLTLLPRVAGASPTAEGLIKEAKSPQLNVVRPKQQLLYLAEVLGFQVQFTDFPKVSEVRSSALCEVRQVLDASRGG